jgi:ATP-dependent Lhr-like helicase
VTIVDTAGRKQLQLRVEVPVEDMAKVAPPTDVTGGREDKAPARPSIWTAIHPRLLALIRAHRSTLLFVNSRRIAERLAAALNELAGETLVRSHHGSIAREQRLEIEHSLKAGTLKALVATSSLELGIDMGAIDLVIQIEAPPSIASGMQRIGRSGHQVGALSRGIIFPKYRGDLVACAAVTHAMHEGGSRSRLWQRSRWTTGASMICSIPFAGRHRLRIWTAACSRASSICWPAATRPTNSPSCDRVSPGTGPRTGLPRARGHGTSPS